MPRAVVIEPLLAAPDGVQIAGSIEDRERLAALEDAGAVVREARVREDVVLVANPDDVPGIRRKLPIPLHDVPTPMRVPDRRTRVILRIKPNVTR